MKKSIKKDGKNRAAAMNQAAGLSHQVTKGSKPEKPEKKKDSRVGRRGDQATAKHLKLLLHPKLEKYFASVSNPWGVTGVRCPVNYNVVPSFVTQYARTTSVVSQHPLAANQSQTLVLYPGHNNLYTPGVVVGATGLQPLSDFDEVAYHEQLIQLGAGYRVVGPMNTVDSTAVTRVPCIGVLINQLGVSGQVGGPFTAASIPLDYGQALPYLSNANTSGHSRWRLVSMGVVVKNTTPELTRGGALITFQPINNSLDLDVAAAIGSYMKLPTWKDHGPDELRVSWIPRMRDLAFWHLTNGTTAAGTVPFTALPGVPGLVVSFQAPTSAQTYDIEVVCNWELAGEYFVPVGIPAEHMPEAKPVVERVHSKLINTAHTAQKALTFAQEAHKAVAETLGVIHKVSGYVEKGVGAGVAAAGFLSR